MAAGWSKSELAELRHHLRLLWISFDPAEAPGDDAYDDYVDEALKMCIDKKPVGELTGFVDWVTYKKFNRERTVDHDEAKGPRVHAGKLRNIARDLTAIGSSPHLVDDITDDALEVRHGDGSVGAVVLPGLRRGRRGRRGSPTSPSPTCRAGSSTPSSAGAAGRSGSRGRSSLPSASG